MNAMEDVLPDVLPVANENTATVSRTTQSGRTITYVLKVIQEPERARACGAGAKSSADRRPVDPPPVVQLLIYEGEGAAQKDITTEMSANYFLFATLDPVQLKPQSRFSAELPMRPAVLTGTPVAGVVYLVDPKKAGYFIFPDLSVRHEGIYRLSFSLFEELKDPLDDDESANLLRPADHQHVTHRHEVKSKAFIVYSAKKFPGLAQSTEMSKLFAEQGCRVRIRRDVRVRRRGGKGSDRDWDQYEDNTGALRARVTATPEGGYPAQIPPVGHDPIQRPQSAGNSSSHSPAAFNFSRRSSLQDVAHPYHTAYPSGSHTPTKSGSLPLPYPPSPTHQYAPPYALQPSGPPPAPSQPPYAPSGYYEHSQPLPPPPPTGQSQWGYAALPPLHHPPPQYGGMPSFDTHREGELRRSPTTHLPTLPPPPPSTYYPPPPPPPPHHHQQPPYHSAPLGALSPQQSASYHQSHAPRQPPYPQHGHTHSSSSLEGYSTRPTPAEPPTRANGALTPLDSKRASPTAFFSGIKPESTSPTSSAQPSITSTHGTPTPTDSVALSTSALNANHKRPYTSVFPEQAPYYSSRPRLDSKASIRPPTPSFSHAQAPGSSSYTASGGGGYSTSTGSGANSHEPTSSYTNGPSSISSYHAHHHTRYDERRRPLPPPPSVLSAPLPPLSRLPPPPPPPPPHHSSPGSPPVGTTTAAGTAGYEHRLPAVLKYKRSNGEHVRRTLPAVEYSRV